MKKTIFTGAGVAIVTPFTETGINYEEFARLIENQIAGGTDAIVVAGTSGEAATMSDEEHKAVIKFCVEQVKGRVPVIAGTGSNDTAYAVQLSQYAESVGVDGLLLVTPYYNKCTQKGLIAHYKAIAEAVHTPIILYDVPSRTGVAIQTQTYVELAKLPNVVAVKEANGDLSKILRLRAAVGDDLDIYSGNDDQIVPILSLGGKGVISVLSNVAPADTHKMCQAFFDGDTKTAEKLQVEYADLIDALFCEVNPIPVKEALNAMGMGVGGYRLPLYEMADRNREHLHDEMRKVGLL